jgi:hypothetical protein
VINGLQAPTRAAQGRARGHRSGAKSCRPAVRWRRPSASPTWALKAPSASRPRCSSLAPASSTCPAQLRRGIPRRRRRQRRVWRGAGGKLTEGVVTRSLDLFLQSPLHIVGEISLLVRHNLLRTDRLAGRHRGGAAHPQALAQCQGWLAKHLPHVERRAVSSNAEGARLAATNPAWAGIARRTRGSEFGLHIGRPRHPGRRLQPHALRGHVPAAPLQPHRPRARTA